MMSFWLIPLLLGFSPTPAASDIETDAMFAAGFDPTRAFELVERLSERWRLRGGGNPGFDDSLDDVVDYLVEGGFERVGSLTVIEDPLTLEPQAWDAESASLEMLSPHPEVLHTLDDTPTLVAKYSRPTPAEGVSGELVDVGLGEQDKDYDGLAVAGKIVLGRGRVGKIFEQAVNQRGALGVLTDRLRKEDFRHRYPTMVLTGTLPFPQTTRGETPSGWGLKISPLTGDRLRNLVRQGGGELRVRVVTRFFDSVQRGLVAEIRGTSQPQERIVLVSHLDNNKPGANNNASGVAAHAELARVLATAIANDQLTAPSRSIVFLFGVEHELSKLWLEHYQDSTQSVVAMLNADMAGADTAKTGGIYRFERLPDPTMSLERENDYLAELDTRSGWGFRPLSIDPYPGHYLGTLVTKIVQETAAETGRAVRLSPFEGGSDHDDFLERRIPAVLSWFWEDPFLSTNLDTTDKVSPEAMRFVARVHGQAALQLASAHEARIPGLLEILNREAAERLRLEQETGKRVLIANAASGDPENLATAMRSEEQRLLLWGQWYQQAINSLADLPVDDASSQMRLRLESAGAKVLGDFQVASAEMKVFARGLLSLTQAP